MGSRSSSNQSTTNQYTTNYSYQTLDGGAIESAFDFGSDLADEAFDSINTVAGGALDMGSDALSNMESVANRAIDSSEGAIHAVGDISESAFDFGSDIALEAMEGTGEIAENAMNTLASQNNTSIAAIGNLQAQNQSQNQETLSSMTELVKSVQTQGATELINANAKTTNVMVIATVIGLVLIFWGMKR